MVTVTVISVSLQHQLCKLCSLQTDRKMVKDLWKTKTTRRGSGENLPLPQRLSFITNHPFFLLSIKFSAAQAPPPHLFSCSACIWKHKLAGWSLASVSHWTIYHIMPSVIVLLKSYTPAVLLLSLPSLKLLSSVYPPSGTSVGGSRVGGSIRLGSYWREWK